MSILGRENELRQNYERFVRTEAGQEWKEKRQRVTGIDTAGDFYDYMYVFYPEVLS